MTRAAVALFIVLLGMLAACESQSELEKAESKLRESPLQFAVPKLAGYSVSYIHLQSPPKDSAGRRLGNKYEALIAYTDSLGGKEELPETASGDGDTDILYGPYKGETALEIAFTNVAVHLADSRAIEAEGRMIQQARNGDATMLVTSGDKGAWTMAYRADRLPDEQALRHFLDAVKQSE